MSKRLPFQALALVALVGLTACGEVEDTRPGQPVKTRQTAFKEIIRSFEPMGVMLREKRYEEEKFLAMANRLMERRDAPWSHFGPDTFYPPTKASERLWKEPERFERARQQFFTATDALLVAAQGKDLPSIEKAYEAAYASCKNCHDPFKAR